MSLRALWNRLFASDRDPLALPPGWTDDMSVPLPLNCTAADVVAFVRHAGLNGLPLPEIEQLLMIQFSLSPSDSALARDRVFGGLVRAATRNPLNCPVQEKDPLAWESYQRATSDLSLVERILPRFAAKADETSTG